MGDVVDCVDKFTQGWHGGLPETPCGYGSTLENTELQRQWIPEVIRNYGIRTIADIGAGDRNWIKHVDLGRAVYKAYDLVPREKTVIKFDIVWQIPKRVDLIMCLWVLNHLPYEDCQRAIQNIRNSGSDYLMMTDRPMWHSEQPPEIAMPYVERLVLNNKDDSIILVDMR